MDQFSIGVDRKRLHKEAERERIELERERHQSIFTAINSLTDDFVAEHQRQAAEDAGKTSREKATIYGLFITAGAALAGLGVTIYQANLTQRSIDNAQQNAKQQQADTAAALAKADTSNQTSVDTEKRQLRAYLSFTAELTFHCVFTNADRKSVSECRSKDDSLDVGIKNSGLTPAFHLKTCHFFQHASNRMSYDVKSAFDMVINRCDRLVPLRSIGPNSGATDSVYFTPESLDAGFRVWGPPDFASWDPPEEGPGGAVDEDS